MNPSDQDRLIVSLLDWYAAMGVDAAVGDAGCDWLATPTQAPGEAVRHHLAQRSSSRSRSRSRSEGQPGSAGGKPQNPPPTSRSAGETGLPVGQRQAPNAAHSATPHQTKPHDTMGRATAAPASRRTGASTSGGVDLEAAAATARAAADMSALSAAIAAYDGCSLKKTAKNTCVYRGAETAGIAVIGEAPGRDEDLAGRPFVGRAGQLLDRMLAAIGLDESSVHITNIVYWRPPGNRAPTPQEALACRPFLERQIELVDPDVILLMGGSAAKQIFSTNDGIMRTRGKWHDIAIGERNRTCLATLHPAYLLRTPAAKHMSWKDLLSVKKRLDGR